VLASGKPCVYLSGLARGLGLTDISLIGENGAEIWVTPNMPPERLAQAVTDEERRALQALQSAVQSQYRDQVFFQPNAVGVTAFPVSDDLPPADIADNIAVATPSSITMYLHVDSVDWAVGRFDKGIALRALAERLPLSPRERDAARAPSRLEGVAAVGDGSNDLPMLRVASLALWLGDPEAVSGTHIVCVPDIHVAMQRLLDFANE
jgi:hydroxymethylpyrimidine pyrophosphatase-like HAD family hydrolase